MTRPTIRPRHPELRFDAAIPRHWFGGNAVATHIVNGVNLLFPAGERFFVRSVKHFLDGMDDPELAAQARGFFGQEGRHARAHEEFFTTLRAQGYRIDGFVEGYVRFVYGFLEKRLPPMLNLAGTAATEHYTAILAEGALTRGFLERAHPELRRLLMWHAAEEIEHRAVAFDVFQKAGGTYAQRVVGMLMATVILGAYWIAGTTMLLRQDGARFADIRREIAALKADRGIFRRVFVNVMRAYLRRDFHPLERDLDALARDYLVRAGLEQRAA
jgi:hypothetical protein